jgi:branched-chain amino acid transport system permease protein
MGEIAQVIVAGLSQGSIYALLGLGFSVVSMSTRVLNIAQGAYSLIGGFLFITLAVRLKIPVAAALALCLLAAVAMGVITERIINLSARPWKPVSPETAILATLAILVSVEGAAFLIWGSDPIVGKPVQPGSFHLLGAIVPWQYVWNVAALIAITAGLHLFLNRTWTGRAMRANAENSLMSYLLGVNVRRLAAISFGIAAAIGAVAGILTSPITWIDYQMGGTFMLFGLLAFLIGGEKSIAGPLVGGLLLGMTENVLLLVPGIAGGLLKQVVPMLALLIMLIFRPEGLLGRKAGT